MIIALLVLCLITAFYLSGLESALMMVNRVHVRYHAEEGDERAAKLYVLLRARNDLFHAATSLCHIFSLASFGLAALVLIHHVGDWGWAIAILLALPIFLLGFELIPKLLFKRHAYSILKRSLTPLSVLKIFSKPLLWSAHRVWPKLVNTPVEAPSTSGVEPLVDLICDQKVIRAETRVFLDNYNHLHSLKVEDVMIPLNRLNALPLEFSLVNALVMARQEEHHWRVTIDAKGDLVGWLNILDLPVTIDPEAKVKDFLKPFLLCKKDNMVMDLLKLLRSKAEPIAGIQDENGELLGIISADEIQHSLLQLPSATEH